MINTVLGKIQKSELGRTRIHEHILWDWTVDVKKKFDRNDVISIMLPHLQELKSLGCDTLVEATTNGAGRDIRILKDLSEKSKLNIITNCGVWDGLNYNGIYIPQELKNSSHDEMARLWINEFEKGVDNSEVKPGFIKIGIGDNDLISDFQSTVLNAAIIASRHTGLPIISHICSSKSAKKIVQIVKESGLELNKFIWSHADYTYDFETITELAKQGIWIELSWNIGKPNNHSWYIDTINKMVELNLLDQLLISQDAGGFHKGNIVSYKYFYTRLINKCLERGICLETIDKLLIDNPANALDN